MKQLNNNDIVSLMPRNYIVFSTDIAAQIMLISDELVQLLGYDNKEELLEICNGKFKNLVFEEDKDKIIQNIIKQLYKGKTDFAHIIFRAITKSGKVHWLEMSGNYTKNDKYGEVCFAYIQDADERLISDNSEKIIDDELTKYIAETIRNDEIKSENIQKILDICREALNIDRIVIIETLAANDGFEITYSSNNSEKTDISGIYKPDNSNIYDNAIKWFNEDGMATYVYNENGVLISCLMYGIIRDGVLDGAVGAMNFGDTEHVWSLTEQKTIQLLGHTLYQGIQASRLEKIEKFLKEALRNITESKEREILQQKQMLHTMDELNFSNALLNITASETFTVIYLIDLESGIVVDYNFIANNKVDKILPEMLWMDYLPYVVEMMNEIDRENVIQVYGLDSLRKGDVGDSMPTIHFSSHINPKTGNITDEKYWYTSKIKIIESVGRKYAIMFTINDTDVVNSKIKQQLELQKHVDIVQGLCNEFFSVFSVDLEKQEIMPYVLDGKYYSVEKEEALKIVSDAQKMDSLIVEEDKEEYLKAWDFSVIKERLMNNDSYTYNFRAILDGKENYFQIKFIKVKDEELKNIIVGVRSINDLIASELEQKKLLEENIRNLEVLQVLSNDYTSVYHVDVKTGNFSIYRLNDNIEKSYGSSYRAGISYEQAMNAYISGTVIDEDKEIMRKYADMRYLADEVNKQGTVTVVYRGKWNDIVHYFRMKIVKVNNDDDVTEVVIGFEDIEDEYQKEKQYRASLEAALVQAKSASNAKTTFLFNMSHDIRTPMNAILGFTSIAKKSICEKDKVENCLEKIETSGEHLLRLINDVLDMARIESGKIEIERAPMNIKDIVHQIEAMFNDDMAAKELEFDVQLDVQDENVYGDQLRFTQVIVNLISNTTKYTKPKGRVLLSTVQLPSNKIGYANYEIRVKDTGIGMSKEFQKKVFQAFEREQSATNSGVQGTGLGLAIAKNIIDIFEGTISVQSEVGIGTEFIINISFKIVETQKEINKNVQENEIKFNGKRILLAEDNELNQEIAYEILTDAGFEVEIAADGAIAVDMLSKSEHGYYNVILMDIQMPFMDGYKATSEIRNISDKELANVPILAMTANAFEEDKRKAFEVGMNGHIAKPINIPLLFETLNKVLN